MVLYIVYYKRNSDSYTSIQLQLESGDTYTSLIEDVLLAADMLELKANPNRPAKGSIIESELDKGRGYLSTILVETGTLKIGDIILAGAYSGKIKAMYDERGNRVKEAGPSIPVQVLGLDGAPSAGENFFVMKDEKEARDELGMTSHEGVFAAGDIVSGPSTIVDAIGSGHCAANGVIKFLTGEDGQFGSRESKEMLIVEAMAPECAGRINSECISLENRQTTFDIVEMGMAEAEALAQANRCRRCGSCSVCSVCLSVCDYRNAVITIIDTKESTLAKIPFDIAKFILLIGISSAR